MTHPRPRSGLFARVAGREYEANSYPENGVVTLFRGFGHNPDPAIFDWNPAFSAWLATVPVGQCERLVEVTTRADYRGLTCQVISIAADGATGLYYIGEDKAKAAESGFIQTGPGTWAKTVPIHDLHTYREHHAHLLPGP